MSTAYSGMCPAQLHGLDHQGQACDLCAEMDRRGGRIRHAMATYNKPFSEPAYCVACPECFSDPLEGCCSGNGRSCSKPHSVRVARSNGLRATPRRGHYQRPKTPIRFNEAEQQAFQLLGHPLPK